MKRSLATCLLLLFTVVAQAQDTLTKLNGEVLVGEISIITTTPNQQFALVKGENGRESVEILDVNSIEKADLGYIKPLKIGGTYRFALRDIDGFLSLYRYASSERNNDFGTKVLVKMDGGVLEVPGIIGFKKLMGDFLNDCQPLVDKIRNKDLGRNDLEAIIEEYNLFIQEREMKMFNESEMNKPQAVAAFPSEKSDLLNQFEQALKNSEKVENKADALQMFNDLSSKIKTSETVPGYLVNALKEAVKNDEALKTLLEEILK